MAPLLFAAKKNYLDMMKLLLDAKAEVNVQDEVCVYVVSDIFLLVNHFSVCFVFAPDYILLI
jgi:hypothetical protein